MGVTNDHINVIALLTHYAIYVDPSKLQLGISEGTIVISSSHILMSQYSNADLQEMGLFLAIAVSKYIKCIDGSRIHITSIVEEVIAGMSKMTRDQYVCT